ncbi:MAG: bifunctional acetate--CoA ligase family protein/GNAT family N-acetyltransferase [Desulfovibrionaceae bacterium]|nr:bifunctional acetate--CoA ligase family protein/GNAT family N-acetyltransferase [Desulfovibrionaceae bacterium]
MSNTNLQYMFRPHSVAVVSESAGASLENAGIVVRNLINSGFKGPVMPVSDTERAVSGVFAYPSVEDLPIAPDLAVVSVPLERTPEIMNQLRRRGARAAILLSWGLSALSAEKAQQIKADLLRAANSPKMRILGPHCLGVMVPWFHLNATMALTPILPGRMAFMSQSDSLFSMVLDWASANNIGFSHVISLGARMDIGFSDMLDYLVTDSHTKAILIYLEHIENAREFMSAARAAAKNKPVVVMRPSKAIEQLKVRDIANAADTKFTPEEVYDVAFRRAGMLRVHDIDSLFHAARSLSNPKPYRGDRLAIITNGTSAGVMAADALFASGGRLAELSEETIHQLNGLLGSNWSHTNPVGVVYNASGDIYRQIMDILFKDKGVDAILMMYVPFAGNNPFEVAKALVEPLKKCKRMVLTSWMGADASIDARHEMDKIGIPNYSTPEHAIRAFTYLGEYARNQSLLKETPDPLNEATTPNPAVGRSIIQRALSEGRSSLTRLEVRQLLAAYRMPLTKSTYLHNEEEIVAKAARAAQEIGFPVSITLDVEFDYNAPQTHAAPLHKQYAVHGIYSQASAVTTLQNLLGAAKKDSMALNVKGVSVHASKRGISAQELFIEMKLDPAFGPVIYLGHGGLLRDAVNDKAVALPPLNMSLARELISRTRLSKVMVSSEPPVDLDELCRAILHIDQMILDLPEIQSIDLNPVYASELGVLVLGGRIEIAETEINGEERLAIRPYPRELEESLTLPNGMDIVLRPIRAEDEPALKEFIDEQTKEDLRLRFFNAVHTFDHDDMAEFTQLDYEREMAFVATWFRDGDWRIVGVVRAATTPDNHTAEFGMMVSSQLKQQGMGTRLLQKMIDYTRKRGSKVLYAETMRENKAMQALARKVGMRVEDMPDEPQAVKLIMEL